jgi:hypothetical protein
MSVYLSVSIFQGQTITKLQEVLNSKLENL